MVDPVHPARGLSGPPVVDPVHPARGLSGPPVVDPVHPARGLSRRTGGGTFPAAVESATIRGTA